MMEMSAIPPVARPLAELTRGLLETPPDLRVSDVTLDSRAASPGALFLACAGRARHGLAFAGEALARGASALLYEPYPGARELVEKALGEGCPDPSERGQAGFRELPGEAHRVFVAPVAQLARHAGVIAGRFFGHPSHSLAVAGITGTNGKTTCAWLLTQALERCGRAAAYMGTLGFGFPGALADTEHTTADAVSVQRRLARLKSLGARWVGMEVSSHALDQHRIAGVRLHTAAFTNLTRDHLDYHGTMGAYAGAKARLFAVEGLVNRVINIDDAFGGQLAAQAAEAALIVTARSAACDAMPPGARRVRASEVRPEGTGLRLRIESSWGDGELTVPLIGEFNADNALTVLAILLGADVPLAEALQALQGCRAAPGRMEAFGGDAGRPLAIVDYAHTPDALDKALRAARRHCRGTLRVVFGCGGDRDAGKRPMMGRIAAGLADEVIVTDDNPRTEAPGRIAADILSGVQTTARIGIEHDRRAAIRLALGRCAPQDVVLVAGKGHEAYQIYGHERRAFRDQTVVCEALGLGEACP